MMLLLFISKITSNMYFKGAFHCNLTVKFTINLFASEIYSESMENF